MSFTASESTRPARAPDEAFPSFVGRRALVRRAEVLDAEKTIEALGYSINRIRPPGTLDGGDVLKVKDTVYVGHGGRTNAAGISQLRSILSPIGAAVVAVPISKVLHLKSAVTALPVGTVIGYHPVVADISEFQKLEGCVTCLSVRLRELKEG